jgi:hypothetical protein
MYTRAFFILLVGIALALPARAQRELGLFGAHFHVGIPEGAFANAFDKYGYGGGGDIFFKVSEHLPFYAGLNFSVMSFESFRRNFVVGLPGGFAQDYRLRVSSNLFSSYLGFRVMPGDGWFRPYAEGLVGFKNFYSTSRLDQQIGLISNWEEIDRETEGDWTLGYGGSAGILFFFGKSGIALDLKCAYLTGGNARINKLKAEIDPIAFEQDPFNAFDQIRTPTNMLIPQIGFLFLLTREEEDKPVYDYTR